jgi:hypothetical protein
MKKLYFFLAAYAVISLIFFAAESMLLRGQEPVRTAAKFTITQLTRDTVKVKWDASKVEPAVFDVRIVTGRPTRFIERGSTIGEMEVPRSNTYELLDVTAGRMLVLAWVDNR